MWNCNANERSEGLCWLSKLSAVHCTLQPNSNVDLMVKAKTKEVQWSVHKQLRYTWAKPTALKDSVGIRKVLLIDEKKKLKIQNGRARVGCLMRVNGTLNAERYKEIPNDHFLPNSSLYRQQLICQHFSATEFFRHCPGRQENYSKILIETYFFSFWGNNDRVYRYFKHINLR